MTNSTSNNTSSRYEQQKVTEELAKSPNQAQQWVRTTAIITKPVIRDRQAGGSNNHNSEAVKL